MQRCGFRGSAAHLAVSLSSSLLKNSVLQAAQKDLRGEADPRARVRENVIEIPNEYEHVPRTRIRTSRASAPFDNAQGNRHMSLFQQSATYMK
jgi:hypothetical protein